MLTIGVPTGIGDISWIYSKLHTLDRKFDIMIVDDSTHRSEPFCRLLPNVENIKYEDFTYDDLKNMEQITGNELKESDGTFGLTANEHLDEGKRLEQWLPDLDTDFYYPLELSEAAVEKSYEVLKGSIYPIGIATAHRDVNKKWNGWTINEWMDLICGLKRVRPFITPVLIGGPLDRSMTDDLRLRLEKKGIDYIDVVGKLKLEESFAVIKRVPMFFSFASGLSIYAVKEGICTFMFYPKHLKKLMYSWCPVDSIIHGWYRPSLWERPVNVIQNINKRILINMYPKEVQDGKFSHRKNKAK